MQDEWMQNINVFISNISPYYAFCVVISVIAVAFSLWYTRRCEKEIAEIRSNRNEANHNPNSQDPLHTSDSCSEDDNTVDSDADDLYDDRNNLENLMGLDDLQARYKTAKQQAILDHLSSKMTPEQIVEEKQTEKAQLEAIFNLLKEQQDKFQVSDMTDLEEQLSLYRV